MPLSSVSEPAEKRWDGVLFPMRTDDGKNIGVLVTDATLADIEPGTPASDDEYVSRCEAHRNEFEQIATNKYDGGDTARPIRI